MNEVNELTKIGNEEDLFKRVSSLIDESRKHIAKAVNATMVYTYYGVGQHIVVFEQNGSDRAAYGQTILKNLSVKLTEKYGDGWSVETLKKCRFFYQTYKDDMIGSTVWTQLERHQNLDSVYSVDPIPSEKDKHCISNSQGSENGVNYSLVDIQHDTNPFTLSWSHYLVLMRIKNKEERRFYEIECQKQDWSVSQLKREYGTSLYERLALSRDKKEVLRLSQEGHTIEKPTDIIKDPLTLEFLGLQRDNSFSKSNLESAIISKLQNFLLEMGKGFLFEARQKKFTFNEKHFYVDLVLYNRLLQCYVLVDL